MITTKAQLAVENVSSAKGRGIRKGSVITETAASIKNDSEKLGPEAVRMLAGLMVANGVIGVLVLSS